VADKVAEQTWKIKSAQEAASGSEGGLSYTIIGVIVATVVGLLGIVLVRTYFRKQTLPAEGADTPGPAEPRQQTRKPTDTASEEKKVKFSKVDSDMPPLEGEENEEGSGDNAAESGSASADSGSEVEAEDDAPVTATKDVQEEARPAKPRSRARRE